MFLATGMRCSALIKLDMNNIDWKESSIVVIDKGNKVHKYILSSNVKKVLKEWTDKRELLLEEKTEEALFISNNVLIPIVLNLKESKLCLIVLYNSSTFTASLLRISNAIPRPSILFFSSTLLSKLQ